MHIEYLKKHIVNQKYAEKTDWLLIHGKNRKKNIKRFYRKKNVLILTKKQTMKNLLSKIFCHRHWKWAHLKAQNELKLNKNPILFLFLVERLCVYNFVIVNPLI